MISIRKQGGETIDKRKLKELLMDYILEFVDLSDKELVGIFDQTFRELKLKNY